MRKYLIVLIAAVLLFSTACSSTGDITRQLEKSGTDYSKELSTDSPEGLAYASSMIYKNLADEKITVEQALEELKKYSSKESLEALAKSEDFFREQIEAFRDYLKANNDSIEGFDFAETVYENPETAYIERIQKQKNGKMYYFRQDFVLEDNHWKISGDNITDSFKLKSRFKFSF